MMLGGSCDPCCKSEWVCECSPCLQPDAIRVTITAKTAPIYHYVVASCRERVGSDEMIPVVTFAYHIAAPSGTFVLQRTSVLGTTGQYRLDNTSQRVIMSADIADGFARFILVAGPLARTRNTAGGTPTSAADMASSAWDGGCNSENFSEYPLPPENGFPVGPYVRLYACKALPIDASISIEDGNCAPPPRSMSYISGAMPTSAVTAIGCVPPIEITKSVPVTMLGPTELNASVILTNILPWYKTAGSALFGYGNFGLYMTSSSLEFTPFYYTPTVWHDVRFSVDAIDMMYGSVAVPMFASNDGPACAI